MNLKRAIIPSLIAALLGAVYATAQVIPQPGPPTPIGGAYNSSPPTLTDGQAGWVQVDNAGNLKVNVASGGGSGGTASTFGAAFPGTGTAAGMSQGGNMVALNGLAGNLLVNCNVGCSGGTFNNNADGVATSATNGQAAAWSYYFNGTTWDRARGDTTNGWFVNVKTSVLPTGAATAANQTSIIGTKNAGTAATNALLAAGVYNATPLTLTDTQQASLQFDANGYLKVNTAAGGGSGGTSSTFGAAFPTTGTAGGMSQGGNMVALTGTSGNLNVQCANCSGSGVSTADEATFTAGTSLFAGGGGFFQTTATANPLTTGQQGMFQVTANRALFTNLRNAAGAEVGVAAVPLQVSLANTGANSNKILVTPDSVALPANQSVNISQINAVTPLMGNGVTGTGSQRVTIASDNTAFAVNAAATLAAETTKVIGTVRNVGNAGAIIDGATGAAPPANVIYTGVLNSGATGGLLAGLVACDQSALLNMTTATTTEIVALTSGRQIHVCSYSVEAGGTTAVKFVQGTGTNCGTGQSDKTANDEWTAQTGISRGTGIGRLFSTTAANALCVTNGSAVNAHINVSYAVL